MAIFRTIRYQLPFLLSLITLIPSTYAACGLKYNHTPPDISDGWSAYPIVVGDFSYPRHLLFDTEGTLLIADRGEGIVALKLKTDAEGCVSVESRNLLIDQSSLNHGIALSKDGKKIYASSATQVWVWDYDAKAGTVSNRKSIIEGMNSGGHTTRTLFIADAAPNKLLVSMGSDGNMDMSCLKEDGGCSIRMFDISELPDKPYDYNDGEILGWGLRNSVGIGEDAAGGIWTVENSADNIRREREDIHHDNPGEEVNYHGKINDDKNPLKGKNYGYPMCFTAWDVDDIPKERNVLKNATPDDDYVDLPKSEIFWDLKVSDQFSLQPNRTFNDTTCNLEYISPRIALEAHTAPLDIKFYRPDDCTTSNFGCNYNNTAFIAKHGSWNRPDPQGYSVGYITFRANVSDPDAAAINSEDAWEDILEPEDEEDCPEDCFRPVGIAFDKQGRMFVTSDSTKELVVITRDNGKGHNQNQGKSAAMGLGVRGWLLAAGVAVGGFFNTF